MVRVLIADKMSASAIDVFKNRGVDVDVITGLSKDELIKIMPDYDGLAVRSSTRPDADIIGAGTKLKVIGRAGIGTDNIDKKAATANGVVVMNTPFGNAITTAEHAISLLLACARQIPAASARTQDGEWPKSDFKGVELYNKTLGVIGCGNIGALVAERALGLKMKVIAFDPYLTEERAIQIGVEKVELEVFKRADAITLHTPLTEGTRGIVSKEALAMAKPGLILVNAARGGLVDEEALKEALDSGHVRAAALDVFAVEPAKSNILFGTKNFIATPHLGASTLEAQENVAVQIAEQMADYLLTGAVTNALNMPSISAEEAPRLKPFVDLAEKLGALTGQLLEAPIKSVEFSYLGDVAALNTKPMTAAALAGLLKPMIGDVNMVSAPSIAADRGIDIKESTQDDAKDHDNLIKLVLTTESGKTFEIAGSIYGGEPRLLNLFGVALDAAFTPSMLYVRNEDKPGFIGALGSILGENNVNIATFFLGRAKEGGRAVCLVSVDGPVSLDIQDQVRDVDHVKFVRALHF